MIRFWWSKVFEAPEIQALDYYCRMDTDSSFPGQVPIDIFAVMRANKYSYGFRSVGEDNIAVGFTTASEVLIPV